MQKRRKGVRMNEASADIEVSSIEINLQDETQVSRELRKLERKMHKHAANLEFEHAARVRDQIKELKEMVFQFAPN